MYYKVPKGPSIHHVSDPSSFFYLKYTINKTMHILISTFLFLIRCKRVFCNVTDICNHAPPQHSDDLDLSAVPCYDPALRRLQVGKTMPVPPPPSPPMEGYRAHNSNRHYALYLSPFTCYGCLLCFTTKCLSVVCSLHSTK